MGNSMAAITTASENVNLQSNDINNNIKTDNTNNDINFQAYLNECISDNEYIRKGQIRLGENVSRMLRRGCVITDNMDNVYYIKEYKLHRPAKEGPAFDNDIMQEYRYEGSLASQNDHYSRNVCGKKIWYDSNEKHHREGDKPAFIGEDRNEYYKHGIIDKVEFHCNHSNLLQQFLDKLQGKTCPNDKYFINGNEFINGRRV